MEDIGLRDKLAFKQDFDPTRRKGAYRHDVEFEAPTPENLKTKIFPDDPVELKVQQYF